MVYADLQLARDADALAVVRDARGLSTPAVVSFYARAAIPARYAVERDQWREAAALADPTASKFPYTEAMTLFARAVGAARSGNSTAAEKDAARLAGIVDALKAANNDYWAAEVEAQRRAAAAWIAFAGGEHDEALGLMRSAAEIEDMSEKSANSPGAFFQHESFWATCCSTAAVSTKRSPPTKRLWSMTQNASAASTAPGKPRQRPAIATRRAIISAASWR
jgi:hypothetical protein